MFYYDKTSLGNKFREYRKKARMTQEELSEKIDIAEKHYGRLERGEFVPSLETFFKLVDVLDIPLTEFGIKLEQTLDTGKEKLIREIYSANEAEVELITNFINSVKSYNEKLAKSKKAQNKFKN